MKHLIWLMLTAAWTVFAQTAPTNHYDILKQSNWFAISGGIANAPTSEAHALTALCGQTNAVATFRRLLQEKGPAQQLYGLLGLQVLATLSASNGEKDKSEVSTALSQALPSLLKSDAKVRVLDGCIAGDREVAEVARQIRDKQWSLRTMPVPGGKYAPALIER